MSRWFEDDFDIRKAPIPPLEDHDLHPTAPTAFGMDGGVYTPLCRCPVDSRFYHLNPNPNPNCTNSRPLHVSFNSIQRVGHRS